jgi:hypothetical protein
MKSIVNVNTTTIESSDDTKQMHDQVSRLLPWYINESLNADEKTLVEEHLKHCQLCQQALANELVLSKVIEPSIQAPNVDMAFGKMMNRIESTSSTTTKNTSSLFQQIRKKWLSPISIPVAWLVLPQLALLLIVTLSLTDLLKDEPNFQALSNDNVNGNAVNSNVVIIFKSKASLAEVTATLQRYDARIVDGPTVTNAYLLHVPNEKVIHVVDGLRIDKNVEYIHQLRDGEKHESLPN